MKIQDLDRNEVYDLTEIKKDIAKFDLLKEWLEKNCHKWNQFKSSKLHSWNSLQYDLTYEKWYMYNDKPTKCALTLFELDITDYQVDCTELSSEQISNLCNIFEAKGYILYHTKDALDVINEMKYFRKYYNSFGIFELSSNKEIIEYDKFIELFGEKSEKPIIDCTDSNDAGLKQVITNSKKEAIKALGEKIDNLEVIQGYKESENKCNYELDFEFIHDLAMRIQNEPKYKPYNWQKPMNIEQLSNAMLRHAIEVKKGNFDDNGELGHLLAIAANAMFIYHQKKHND